MSPRFALVGLLLAWTGTAQQVPVFRAVSEHVRLEVVVRDRAGKPVADLTVADFEVRDAGRVQQIESLQYVVVPPVHRDLTAARVQPRIDVVTNTPPPEGRAAISIVFDDGSLEPDRIVPTKRALQEILSRFSDEDVMSLTFVGRSDLGLDFTTDVAALMRAIDGVAASAGSPSTISTFGGVRRTFDRDVFLVLGNVVRTLAAARESRRFIVYVSRGTMEGRSPGRIAYGTWNELFAAARAEGIPIYTLDPGGLVAPELGFELPYESQAPDAVMSLNAARRGGQRFLQEAASNTGGLAFVDRWDLATAVEELATDTSSYYVLGYTPVPAATERAVRSVQVRMAQSGLTAYARSRYLAEGGGTGTSGEPGLREVLEAGLPGGNLPLSAVGTVVSAGAKTTQVLVGIVLPAGTSGPHHVSWVALDADGRVRAHGETAVTRPAATVDRVQPVLMPLEVPSNATVVRVGVAAPSVSAVGVVHVSLEEAQRLRRVRGWTILPAVVGDAGAVRPLALGVVPPLGPIVPTMSRQFDPSTTVQVLTRVAGDGASKVTVDVLLVGADGERRARLIPVTGFTADDRGAALPLTGLPPGPYVLALVAEGPTGERQVQSIRIDIKGDR